MVNNPREGDHSKPEEQAGASVRLNRMTRRGFLGLVGVLSSSALAYRLQKPAREIQQATALIASPDTSVVTENDATKEQTYQGLTLFIDAAGIPDAYLIEDSNEGVKKFSDREKQFFARRRAEAMAGSEFIPVHQIQALDPHFHEPTLEKPYVNDQPENVLTYDQLAKRGVFIGYSSEFTTETSRLFLRESAFQRTGVLEPLTVLQENSTDEEKVILEILVRNTVSLKIAPNWIDPSTNSIRNSETELLNAVSQYRKERIRVFEDEIQNAYIARQRTEPNSADYWEYTRTIYTHRASQMLFLNTLSDEELLPLVIQKQSGITYGWYQEQADFASSNLDRNMAMVTVAAPELYKAVDSVYFTLGFKTDGSIIIVPYYLSATNPITARMDQSYPNPAEFDARTESSEYKYKVESIGFVLYHETAHFLLIDIFPKLAAKGLLRESEAFRFLLDDDTDSLASELKKAGVTLDQFPPIHDERITDLVAMSFIRQAYKRWQESGFKDDTGYSFVFKVPQDQFYDGGYQITNLTLPQTDVPA